MIKPTLELALEQAESRGGTLLNIPTNEQPLWTCHRQHTFSFSAEHILEGMWCEECTESLGERAVRLHLKELGLEYKCEVTFPGLVVHGQLRFDFYIPSLRLLIEVDGEQHFRSVYMFKGSLLDRLQHDEIKDDWCRREKFSLLRIPYWYIAKTEEMVEETVKKLQNTTKTKEKLVLYICEYKDWREKAVKLLKQKKKAPRVPEPEGAREDVKESRKARREDLQAEIERSQIRLAIPKDLVISMP